MTWTEQDPGQGNPAGIAYLSAELQAVSDAAVQAKTQLQALKDNTSDAIWRGTTADAFRNRIAKLPAHLDRLANSYADAADGFAAYGAKVEQIKHDAQLAHTRIAQAGEERNQAKASQSFYALPIDPATGAPLPGSRNPYDEAVAAAEASIASATAALDAEADIRRAADSTVKGRLDHAHHDGMKNRPWWSHALEDISTDLTVVAMVLLVVAVICVVLMFPEILIAFAGAEGIFAGLVAAASFAGGEIAGITTALSVVGALSVADDAGLAGIGEMSWTHVGIEAAFQFGPGPLVKGTRYLAAARVELTDARALSNAAADADQWSGPGSLSLTAADNTSINQIVAGTSINARKICTNLVTVTKYRTSSRLESLENQLKTPDSLKRKVATMMSRRQLPLNEIVPDLNDAIRYTITTWRDENYIRESAAITHALQSRGYEIVSENNTWEGQGYKGINTTWRDPANGQLFEVQFHTQGSSFASLSTHPLYEVLRLPDTSPMEAAELRRQIDEIYANVSIPKDAIHLILGGS